MPKDMKTIPNYDQFLNEIDKKGTDDAHTIADEFMKRYNKRDKVGAKEWEQFIYDTFVMDRDKALEIDGEDIDEYTIDDVLNILGDNQYIRIDLGAIGDLYE